MGNALRQLGGRGVLRGVRRGIPCGVAEGSEDPWLCGPGFHRVCRCRGATYLRRGTETVKQSGTPSLRLFLLPPALAHYPERLAVDDRRRNIA